MNAIARIQADLIAASLTSRREAEGNAEARADPDAFRVSVRQRNASDAAARRAQAKRVGSDAGVVDGQDHGPSVRTDVERGEWRDPADTNLRRKAPRTIQGKRRVWVLMTMAKRPGPVEFYHVEAARKYLNDYEVGVLGGRQGRDPNAPQGNSDPSDHCPETHRLHVLARYRRARTRIGLRMADLIQHVALDNADIGTWGPPRGYRDAKHVVGMLVAALEILAECYNVSHSLREEEVDEIKS